MDPASEKRLFPLVSLRTMLVKAAALLLGLWAGASTGREGPTVHVAACAFVGVMVLFRRALGLSFDPRSAVVAGGAAGLAAAFNTPLAGVTFAIEELSGSYFASIKDSVLMAIIVAAIAAKAMTGEYGYFGRLQDAPDVPVRAVVLIGLLGGALGAFFSTAIVWGRRRVSSLNGSWGRWAAPPLLAVGLLLLARRGGGWMEGPGNGAAQALLTGAWAPWALAFPLTKMAATLFTYWSGIAGGIFAPCLAIGAALGSDLSLLAGGSANACALVGMAAFLAGTIQAPMTAFVIIFEMTGQHQMLLPVMLGSLLAFMTARVLRAKHLYDSLASSYSWLLVS
jgi:H+/Cl- antiporter ClcA